MPLGVRVSKALAMRFLLTGVFFITVYVAFAQGYADNWVILNNFGLNFSSGNPVSFSSSAQNYDNFIHFIPNGAISSISDKNGALLFYACNDTVYNSQHVMMDNGFDIKQIEIGGSYHHTSVIVPLPHNDSIFYLIHLGSSSSNNAVINLYCSVININSNNGLGTVIQKNILVDNSSLSRINLSCLFNDNKNRYEFFYATLTASGINNPGGRMAYLDSTGIHVVASPNPAYQLGSLASAWNVQGDKYAEVGAGTSHGVFKLWSYNKHNSTFSLDFSINLEPAGYVAFSPSGKYVYITASNASRTLSYLWRYDISYNDTNLVKSSRLNLISGNPVSIYQVMVSRISLAPDQRIYVSYWPKNPAVGAPGYGIGAIQHPDSTYAGNFNPNFVNTLGKKTLVFPNIVTQWVARPPFSLRHSCQDSVVFNLTYKNMVDSVFWDFGDPASGSGNYSSALNPVHHYSGFGSYWVQVVTCWQGTCDTLADSINVEPVPVVNLPHDTLLCLGDVLTLDIGQGFAANYLWSTGSTDSMLNITQSGTYLATAFTACGISTDSITVQLLEPPSPQLKDTTVCDNFTIALHIEADSATYLWSTRETAPTIYPPTSGNYSVQVQNPCGSMADQATVTYKRCLCNVYVPNAFTPDGDGLNDSFGPVADCPNFTFTMHIFNRWGQQVAVLSKEQPTWDGTFKGEPVPNGVYSYRLIYKGTEYERTKQDWINGLVNVLR